MIRRARELKRRPHSQLGRLNDQDALRTRSSCYVNDERKPGDSLLQPVRIQQTAGMLVEYKYSKGDSQ